MDLPYQKSLSEKEMKNVFLAVACGCLEDINTNIPGPDHLRQKRVLRQFRRDVLNYIAPRLPIVKPYNMGLFKDTITVSDKILKDIVKDTQQRIHVLLNLTGFCLHELPMKEDHWDRFNKLFPMWVGVYDAKDIRSGDRIFLRIKSEVQILVAQRGGVIL